MAKKTSRTREARQRRQQQRRRNKRGLVLLAIAIVAVVAVAILIVSNQPVDVFIPPDLQDRYEGIARSFSTDGYPQLGDQDAPVTVDEFASFACPGCEALHSDSFDAILERVRSGQILFSYVPLQTGSIPNASGAARAALCAGKQNMFWEMHDVLFDWQTRYANTAYSQNRLLGGVTALGLIESAFTSCFNSAAINETLNAAMSEEVTGTPTININGVSLVSQQAGGIPTTAEILQAIDVATPDDWGQEVADVVEPIAEQSPEEPSGEDGAASSVDAADSDETEATVDREVTDSDDEPDAGVSTPAAEEAQTADGTSVDQADVTEAAASPSPDDATNTPVEDGESDAEDASS